MNLKRNEEYSGALLLIDLANSFKLSDTEYDRKQLKAYFKKLLIKSAVYIKSTD